MEKRIPLEAAAEKLCNPKPPLIFQLPPEKGRETLESVQDSPVYKYPASVKTVKINTGKWGHVPVHIVRPESITGTPDVIFYIHGAGWVFGSLHTHDKLVRELGARTNSVVIFPEYSRSPEAKYPAAIEQCYAVLNSLRIVSAQTNQDIDLRRLTVAGDSAGGNMAAAITVISKIRSGPAIHKQLLYYPVTNANFNTNSYTKFASGYYLYRKDMMRFWDQYMSCGADRRQITASPLLAKTEQLCGLPPAMIITGEADVLRDEGEAYARKLLKAGVNVTSVRVNATIHDFVMLNSLDQTEACRTAMDMSTAWINR